MSKENTYFLKVLYKWEKKVALGKRSLSHFFTSLNMAIVEKENKKRKKRHKKPFKLFLVCVRVRAGSSPMFWKNYTKVKLIPHQPQDANSKKLK